MKTQFGVASALIAISCFLITCKQSPLESKRINLGTFGAFYTKINSGEEFEKYSRTGDYADIVVDLGSGDSKFVFWRGSSYLPYLETSRGKWYVDELVPRKGNGEGIKPDKINAYSHVKIIESTDQRVVVHWRYLPEFSGLNPHTGVDATSFVDEYFFISPDGIVERSHRKGTAKSDAWKGPENLKLQTFELKSTGIKNLNSKEPGESMSSVPVLGSPLVTETVRSPVLWWKFDEAAGDYTKELISGHSSKIHGHKSLWKKGVSGTALQFDGYNTYVSIPAGQGPVISAGITLEAWLAIGAYPWNWTPLVQQGDDDGFFLGLDGHGHPGLKMNIGGQWKELVSDAFLKRNTWYHVAGTFDPASGSMRVYVDGKPVGARNVGRAALKQTEDEIKVGKGINRRPTDPVRANTFADSYGFDGIIDEVRIYNTGLSSSEVNQAYALYGLTKEQKDKPDMEIRSLPDLPQHKKFEATYTHLKFYETWDNLWRFSEHPDVVVTFDKLPTKFVFWRGTGYIPMMVNEKGHWYSNEFNETWGTSGGQGCQEPMSDKEAYTNFARIIESSDARIVVHWRYPLLDVLHVFANVDQNTGWGDWSDWYYYIYPDGVAVKKMHLWTHGERNHEWQESMGIFGPNQHPEQVIETEVALTMVALDGEQVAYSWLDGPPENVDLPLKKVIQHVNYKADYDPVTIGNFTDSDVYNGEQTPYSVFPTWNHWPVAQMPSDGRYASFPDRTAHSSLTHLRIPTFKEDHGRKPFQQKLLMEGMLNQAPSDLIPLAASWLSPPGITDEKGCVCEGYDRSQRAFVLEAVDDHFSMMLEATKASPLVNPCFVVHKWKKDAELSLKVNGELIPEGLKLRKGINRETDGSWTLVIWLEMQTSEARLMEFGQI